MESHGKNMEMFVNMTKKRGSSSAHLGVPAVFRDLNGVLTKSMSVTKAGELFLLTSESGNVCWMTVTFEGIAKHLMLVGTASDRDLQFFH